MNRMPGITDQYLLSDDLCHTFCVGQKSYIDVIRLFDGILLWANEIHLAKLSYPSNVDNMKDYLFLNICHFGRCEVELFPGSYVYMSPGILNMTSSSPKSSYCYPGGRYSGIEFCFNMCILKNRMPDALAAYGFDYAMLERYAAKGNTLAALTSDGMCEEEKLFHMIRGKKASLPAIRFAALSLLYHLTNGSSVRIHDYARISKGQKHIAIEVEKMMTADLQKRCTIEEAAARFKISPSALKKYFVAVYGSPISRYMHERRMEKAAMMLASTNKSVGTIALHCGYEHSGKFGTAFKTYAGVSAMEYRRLKQKMNMET